MSSEHSIAIVSFQGAIERESKRVCNALRNIENIHDFKFNIRIRGNTSGTDVEIEYEVGSKYGDEVEGNDVNAVLDEFMRRHGWSNDHQVKAITFQDVPS